MPLELIAIGHIGKGDLIRVNLPSIINVRCRDTQGSIGIDRPDGETTKCNFSQIKGKTASSKHQMKEYFWKNAIQRLVNFRHLDNKLWRLETYQDNLS